MPINKIYNKIKKLTKEQKKIISIGIIVFASLFIFWVFVYQPESRKFAAIKNKLKETEAQVAQIISIAGGKDLASAFVGLQGDLIKALSKLPRDDQNVIYALSDAAKKLHLEVKSIAPLEQKLSNKNLPGYELSELPVSINLSCELKALGEYLTALRDNFPILVRIKQVDIKGRGEGQADLDVNLQISAYLSK